MKRWTIALVLIVSCVISGAVGYWFGFREALPLGVAADFLPRGAIAIGHLKAIRSGKPANVLIMLEYDVDSGLLWADDVLRHPLRSVFEPLWGFDLSLYDEYAVRLANYRKEHPSLMKPDAFDKVPPGYEQYRESYREMAQGARETIKKLDAAVKRYASP
jgi:hypothetical protein